MVDKAPSPVDADPWMVALVSFDFDPQLPDRVVVEGGVELIEKLYEPRGVMAMSEYHSAIGSPGDVIFLRSAERRRAQCCSPVSAERRDRVSSIFSIRSSNSKGLSKTTAPRSPAVRWICSSPKAVMRIVGGRRLLTR